MASKNTITNASVSAILHRQENYYTPEGWKELQELYAVSQKVVNTLSEPEKALLWKGFNENMQELFRMMDHLLEADKEN